MSFRTHRALAVAWKEALDLKKNPGLVASMLALPAALVLVPVGIIWSYVHNPDDISLRTIALYYDPGLPLHASAARFLVDKLLADWFGLFLLMPVFTPILISSQSVAGEKERRTLESLLHLPIAERDLFYAKVLGAWIPAVLISWIGFVVFAFVANGVAWPVVHRVFVPTALWVVMIVWLSPAVAALGMGVMVRVSARAHTAQEANQLGGAVILPLIFATVAQSTGLLLVSLPIAIGVGIVVWGIAITLLSRGAARFTRDRLAASL